MENGEPVVAINDVTRTLLTDQGYTMILEYSADNPDFD